jgi:hypothetical protein
MEQVNWAAGQSCTSKSVQLYDDVATALSANFEALKAHEESARYPAARTKSAALVPVLAAGGVAAGCFMLHNKLDCGVQCVDTSLKQCDLADASADTSANWPRILRAMHVLC